MMTNGYGAAQDTMVIRGGRVLTETCDAFRRADVRIAGNRIVAVETQLPELTGERVVRAEDRLVVPGFVNAHTHAHCNLARGAIDGLPLEAWLQHLAARVIGTSPRDIYLGTVLGALEMARTGTTTACEMAAILPWPTDDALDAVAQAYRDVGLRVNIAAQIYDLPFLDGNRTLAALLPDAVRTAFRPSRPYPRHDVIATIGRAIARWHGAEAGRIRFGVGPTIVTMSSDALLESCAALAAEHGTSVQTHLAETRALTREAQERYGHSACRHLDEMRLLGPHTVLAHSCWLDDEDMDLIAERGATVAHNPMSNLKMGAGVAPLPALLSRGCNVGLGTDGSACSDNQNLFGAIRQATILHRVFEPDHRQWPKATDTLRMATVGGACAAGFDGSLGRIAPGQLADLVLLDAGSTYFHPANDLVAQLVHAEVGSSVRSTIVDGRMILDEGRIVTVDEAELLAEVDEAAERAAARAGRQDAIARQIEPYVRRLTLSAASHPG